MKVDVIQAKDIKFRKFMFFSDWFDIAIFEHSSVVFLIQMKVSRFNRKSFRLRRITGHFQVVSTASVGDLTQMENGKCQTN